MKSRIIISETFDPAYNLGLEEYLIETGENILYLWQNDNTIVIGRNQNPYRECNINKMKEDGIKLVRRRSGGGAVFHDMGNLNFTIISKKHEKNIEDNFQLVNEALSYENIESVFNGRNDLHVDNKKISGNAFYEDEKIFCHHGTLLIDVDMDKLSSYLTASKLKLKSKGIESVKSRVINLKEINSDISVEKIKAALIKAYEKDHEVSEIEYFTKETMEENPDLMKKIQRYNSWEWVYGESPKSNVYFDRKFRWGIIEFEFYISSGKIKEAKIFSDSIINEDFQSLSQAFIGRDFKKEEGIKVIEENVESEEIRRDLIEAIKNI